MLKKQQNFHMFVKYGSDKFKGAAYGDIDVPEGGSFDDMLALIGSKNIGEEMDKNIARLAEANSLRGVIDNAHFNDEDKLGKGKEMVDKLSKLLCIFRDQMPDFSKNRADSDDIIGDAYEYLMRNFAAESGKSKGQFYTPAEVSRILAKVVGIEHAHSDDITLYDPACGFRKPFNSGGGSCTCRCGNLRSRERKHYRRSCANESRSS